MYAVPDKINQTEYALNAAIKLLDFYDDYFGIPYPLPKQGQYETSDLLFADSFGINDALMLQIVTWQKSIFIHRINKNA